MSTLLFICILDAFSYHSSANGRYFRGSSKLLGFLLPVIGGLGQIATFVALIWSFWPFEWWQSVLTAVGGILLGVLTGPIFQRTLLGNLLSPILVVVFGILSFWGLSSM